MSQCSMNSTFRLRSHCDNATLKMTRSQYNDENENCLNYLDFFQRLVELQNGTSHRQTIIFIDFNEKKSINQTEIF